MNIQIQPGVTIALKGLYYQVAGIDTYTLRNQIEPPKQWKSYTLVGNNQRIGLTQIDNEFELWDSVPDIKIPTSQLTFNSVFPLFCIGECKNSVHRPDNYCQMNRRVPFL